MIGVLAPFTGIAPFSNAAAEPLAFPPALPGGAEIVTDRSEAFLRPPEADVLRPGVAVAKVAPEVDFLYYPGQDYPGKPWSVWGDGCAAGGRYYSAIGDHLAPGGNAFVYSYDPGERRLRQRVDVRRVLGLPEGHYTPGKIHTRVDLGADGWLYFATHRGSTRVTTERYHFRGDWLLRHHPGRGVTEVLSHGPVPLHCIPTGRLDPERLIFYGGTAAGDREDKTVFFFAFDTAARKVLHRAEGGPYRYLMLSRSTGRVYYVDRDGGPLMRYDPASGRPPERIPGTIGLRAATDETPDGFIYTVSTRGDGTLWRFDVRSERAEAIGEAAVGSQDYITSLDASPDGRYLYYVPGAHGGGQNDGSPVVQFDTRGGIRKVIAFLHPYYRDRYGYTPLGTFATALDPAGDKLYITWNGNRGGSDRRGRLPFDTCALTVVHIPEEERRP